MENIKSNNRIYGLDILRAFAIVNVMQSHGYDYSSKLANINYYKWITFDGVGLFFVLSGFLIGGILLKTIREQEFSFTQLFRFWLRRWFRTLPNYFLVLIILIACYHYSHHCLPPQWMEYFCFTQCFASPHPLFFGEAWSLAVEEWFYLIVPFGFFLILLFSKEKNKAVLFWIVFVLIAGTLVRIYKVYHHNYFIDGTFGVEISKQVVTRMDGLMYGMLGAWISLNKNEIWERNKNVFFVLGLILLIVPNTFYNEFYLGYFHYSVEALGTLFILPKLNSIKSGSGKIFKAITFISVISYSMYLTNHMIVQRAFLPKINLIFHLEPATGRADSAINFILFWSLTILFSWLLYRFWEMPVMKLREKFRDSNITN